MKKIYLFTLLLSCTQIFAQKEIKGNKTVAGDSLLTSGQFLPSLFMGSISQINGKQQVKLNTSESTMDIDLRIRNNSESKLDQIIINGSYGSTDNVSNLFDGKDLNPKIKMGLNLIGRGKKYLNYIPGSEYSKLEQKADFLCRESWVPFDPENYKYEQMLKETENYNVKSQHFRYLLFGFNYERAKFNLLDSSKLGTNVLQKKFFNGLQIYGQIYFGKNYFQKSPFSIVHTFRYSYGETNNISDLDAYDYIINANLGSKNSTSNANRKKSAYLAQEYQTIHQHKLEYEINYYPTDTTKIQLGIVMGFDATVKIENNSFSLGSHMGVNLPIEYNKKEGKRFFIAILSNLSSPNLNVNSDYEKIRDYLSVTMRLGIPLGYDLKMSE